MMSESREHLTVHIVDDDASIRDSMSLLLSVRKYRTALFSCAEDFLDALEDDWAGCVVADIKMPGMSGLELLQRLTKHAVKLPVVIVTAHGSLAAARDAFKSQAVDFLEKPYDSSQLVAAVESAFERERARLSIREETEKRKAIFTQLSDREREVMSHLVLGKHNRKIGEELGISQRTVEVHKTRLMTKLGARNLADLIKLASEIK
jgi:FixJ family two-component response regulator